MARIIKQQESLKSAFKKRAGAGLGVAITGVLIIAFFNQAQAGVSWNDFNYRRAIFDK